MALSRLMCFYLLNFTLYKAQPRATQGRGLLNKVYNMKVRGGSWVS